MGRMRRRRRFPSIILLEVEGSGLGGEVDSWGLCVWDHMELEILYICQLDLVWEWSVIGIYRS